ncbi:methyltransferase domain-containing protein [Acidobacteriota bacterium]
MKTKPTNLFRQGRKSPISGKNRPFPRTLGPVADLERHLPSEWWRELFNALYLKTDGDVVDNEINTKREVDLMICSAGLEQNDKILDLCCGQGRHSIELASRGFAHVVGLDRSRYLVQLAKRRAGKLNISVQFHEGDARNLRFPDDTFHCVAIMGNSFGYFEREDDDEAVLRSALRILKSKGMFILDLVDGDWMRCNFEPRTWEWIDQNHFVCRERALAKDGGRLIAREVVVHAEKGVLADQFYAERLYSRDSILHILHKVGFASTELCGEVIPHSDRDQDLGMMAHRLFFVASAPMKAHRKSKVTPFYPRVTVLLGDPTLPDSLKRNGRFNLEDIETVDRLKRALCKLSDYRFTYLDRHDNLLSTLRREQPDFALNLCDEGFMNSALMEAHITTYLEMLEIPYSGADAACLTLCYDKSAVRAIASMLDIPVPLETYIRSWDQSGTMPSDFPALIKPNKGDSSLGITQDSVVLSPEHFVEAMNAVRRLVPDRSVIVQEFLEGTEYSVALIGNPSTAPKFLPVLEVDFSDLDCDLPPILGYESKWLPDSPYWTKVHYREASIDDSAQRALHDYSLAMFERLGCRDYARFDFRADRNGVIKLLEVNPNPGWCWDGKLNLMAGFAGMRYADLLRMILEEAQRRVALSPSQTDSKLERAERARGSRDQVAP